VVAGGACSSVLHTVVAIVAPATSASAARPPPGADLTATRPAMPAEIRARVLQQQQLGRMAP
jgi:hypothetical protein